MKNILYKKMNNNEMNEESLNDMIINSSYTQKKPEEVNKKTNNNDINKIKEKQKMLENYYKYIYENNKD